MRSLRIFFPILLLLIFVQSFNSFLGQPLSDDVLEIFNNSHFVNLEGYLSLWANRKWPFALLIQYLLYSLGPKYVLNFHLINILIHSLNCLLLYMVLSRFKFNKKFSLIIAAIFALHVCNVVTTSWIIQLKTVLSYCFALLSTYTFIRFRETNDYRTLLTTISFYIFLLLTKSSFALLPIFLIFVDVLYFNTRKIRSYLTYTFPMFVLLLINIYYFFRPNTPQHSANHHALYTSQKSESFITWLIYKASFIFDTLTFYIYKILIPLDITIFYPHFGETILMSKIIKAFCLFSFTCLFIILLKNNLKNRKLTPYTLSIVVFTLSWLPISGIIKAPFMSLFPTSDVHAYGIIVPVAICTYLPFLNVANRFGKTFINILLILFISYNFLYGIIISNSFRSEEHLFRRVVKLNPEYFNGYIALGDIANNQNKFQIALNYYIRAYDICSARPQISKIITKELNSKIDHMMKKIEETK